MDRNYTDDEFNKKANEYLSGHGRNFLNSLTGKEAEKVQPWFGSGGVLETLNNDRNKKKVIEDVNMQESKSKVNPVATPTLSTLADIKPIVNSPATIKTAYPSQVADQNARPSAMKQYTPEGGMDNVTSTAPFPKPGSTLLNAGNSNNPRAVPVKLNQLANAGKQTGITRGNGFEFQGTAEDAAKFMGPVGNAPQMVPTGRMIQARSTSDYLPKEQVGLQMPKYLGPESGIGWKTRAKLYEAQMDAYNKAMGNRTNLDIEKMRLNEAGHRTLAQANQWNAENQLNAKKIGSDTALAETQNEVGKLALLQEQNLQAAKSEYIKNPTEENKIKLNTLLYDPKKSQQQQPDVKVIDKFDPITKEKIGQTVVRDDGSGNYVDAMKPQAGPDISKFTQKQKEAAVAYSKANPKMDKAIILQKIASGEI